MRSMDIPILQTLKVTGNTFNEINSRGIHGGSSSNAFINNNTLLNTGNLPGMGSNGADSYTAIISNGDNAEVSYNSITNAGYVGIRWDGNAAVIKNNFVNTTNYIKDDGGGIYCYPNQLGAVAQSYIQRTVSNNIVINSIGAIAGGTPSSGSSEAMGIYNDGASPNVTYTNNTISNAHLGLYFNGGHEITSSGNTIYNCSRGYYIVNSIASIGIANNTVTNNIFVARDANQYAAYFEPGSSSMPSSFTANNNIYARPIDDNVTIWRDANGTNYYNTLTQWRSYSGQDAASGKSPVNISNINDLRLVYNETATSKTISLGANYIDMKSVSYPGSITLAPYTSAVLVKTGAGNATPTANAGTDKTITLPTATVSLTGSGTDADGTIASYLWTKISGPTAGTIISAASASTTVSSLVQGIYKFELKVTDNAAATGRDTMQVTVNLAGNIVPSANAGTDKTITLPTATVSLTGSGTDADGTIVSYLWTKISGPTAGTIISAASASTSVSSLVQGVYKFELKVTDNAAATGRDTIQVTVNAVAGASNAYGGTAWPIPGTIQVEDFDNGGPNVAYYDSSPENLGGAYRLTESIDLQIATEAGANIGWSEPGEWTKYSVNVMTAGIYSLQARLSSQNATSSFRVEMDGVTIATITVPNTGGYQTWQTVTIPNINLSAGLKMMRIYFITGGFNINYLAFTGSVNLNPAANAGADKSIALPTAAVNLAGSGTDADGTIASYAWTKISGPAGAVITSATNASTSVTALVQGIYKFELKVTDNATAVGRDTMQVIVNAAGNIVPTANAGSDKTIVLPISVISLLGTGTDSDGTIASYKWLKITGSNTAIITSSTSAATTVTGLTEGTYDFELTVTDNSGATAKDNVQVIVSAAYTVGEKIINVNIYGGTNPLADTKWNNWKSVSKSVSSNFKYEDGTQSKVNAVLSAQQKIGNNGTGYASSATSCPPAVLQYYSTNSAQRSLTIKGLSASGQYTFRFYASSSVVSNGTTFLIGTVSDDIMTDNNVNNVAQIVNVKPDANGTVVVKLLSINTYNYIAGFTIIEQSGQVAGRSVQSVVEEEAALPALKTIIEETKVSVSIFPNPFTTLVKIQLNGGPAGVYQLSLIDISGRPIWKKALNKAGGAITEPVNTSNLPGGVYILQVISPDKIQSSIKIMKLN
jgi:hypothetical protein